MVKVEAEICLSCFLIREELCLCHPTAISHARAHLDTYQNCSEACQ